MERVMKTEEILTEETENEKVDKMLFLVKEKSKLLEFIDQEIRVKGNKDEDIFRESRNKIYEIENEIKMLYNEIGDTQKIEEILGKDLNPETGNAVQEIRNIVDEKKSPAEDLEKAKDEVEGIKDGDRTIKDSLDGDNSLKAGEIRDESDEIVDEAAGDLGELEGETGNTVGSESDRRIKEWKEMDDGKKKEKIRNYKKGLRGDVEAMLAEGESIEERIEELRDEVTEFALKTADVAGKLEEQTGGLEQEEARKAIRDMAENAKKNLDIAKLDYFQRTEGDLMETHKDKEITIENLEEMADDLENLENFLRELEGKSEGAKIEAQKEALAFGKLIIKLAEDPRTLKILKAAGVIVGVLTVLTVLGLGGHAVYTGLVALGITTEQAAVVTGLGTLAVSGYLFSNKEQRERLKEYGKIVAGGAIGAGILALSVAFKKENWDKFLKGLFKENDPDWYKGLKNLLGLGETETSKS